MKEVFYFLKWCWRKMVYTIKSWDLIMWMWMATCFTGSMWANSDQGSSIEYYSQVVMISLIVLYWCGYLLVYTGIKKAWNNYQEEKQKVINILGERNEFSPNGR